jgi:hypothetical protein
MWLVAQRTILTKDNMISRNWHGDSGCYFCGAVELFQCPVTKVVWGIIAMYFHQRVRPNSYEQFWPWIRGALPGGEKIYMFGLAAVCCAIWTIRSKACFDKILIKNSYKLIFSPCLFMKYWAELFAAVDQNVIKARVDTMLKISTNMLKRSQEVQGPRLMLNDGDAKDDEAITVLEEY